MCFYLVIALIDGEVVSLLWRKVDTGISNDFFIQSALPPAILRVCMAMLFAAYPSLVTRRSLAVVYAIVIFSVMHSDQWVESYTTASTTNVLSVVVVISLCYRDVPVIIAVQVVNTVANVILGQNSKLLRTKLQFAVPLCAIVLVLEHSHIMEVRALFEAKALRNSQIMAERLFRSMCDATVHLDGALRISLPSPHLAAFLLRMPSLEEMLGTWFPELLHDDDEREAFTTMIIRPSGTFANTMHVRFRDADGIVVPAQLFHTCGLNANDEVTPSLGITGTVQGQPLSIETAIPSGQNRPTVIGRSRQISEGTSSLHNSETLPWDTTSPTAIAVWVDAFSTDLRMLKTTPGFLQFSGPDLTIGTNFCDFVDSNSAQGFLNSFQLFVNQALHDPDHTSEGCEIRLKTHMLSSRVRGYKARAHFTMDDAIGGCSSESDTVVVRLELSDIKAVGASVYDMPRANRTGGRRKLRVSM